MYPCSSHFWLIWLLRKQKPTRLLTTRKAFTHDAMPALLDRELSQQRESANRQRIEDGDSDPDWLERIGKDIRDMRDLMFEAFQRRRTD